MIIDLASVGSIAKDIAIEFDPAEIDLDGENARLGDKVRFAGETQQVNNKAHVRGQIKADLLLGCTRCLDPIERRVDISFDDVFVDPDQASQKGEIEIGSEELDESLVNDGKIDLAEVVREQIMLVLPEQVYCKEDCKGLCPKCGANQNLIDCKCADDEVDPRWAALKNLR